MGYQKRYEDSYLDEEEDDFDGAGFSDSARLVLLIRKVGRTERETAFLKKLTDRLTNAAKMPGVAGKEALDGLTVAAEAYFEIGQNEKAIEVWARIVDIAETMGDKDLYYKAVERMADIGE